MEYAMHYLFGNFVKGGIKEGLKKIFPSNGKMTHFSQGPNYSGDKYTVYAAIKVRLFFRHARPAKQVRIPVSVFSSFVKPKMWVGQKCEPRMLFEASPHNVSCLLILAYSSVGGCEKEEACISLLREVRIITIDGSDRIIVAPDSEIGHAKQ